MKLYQASHTFTRRPVSTQIIAYTLLIFELLVFFICLQSNLEDQAARTALVTFFSLTFAGVIVSGAITSCTEPVDAFLKEDSTKLRERKRKQGGAHLFCQLCRSVVQENTRHCKTCDLCIEEFDHHCIWINNCIGKHNYKSFIVMLVCVTSNFILFHSALIAVWREQLWDGFLASMIVSWAFGSILLVFTILLLSLLGFHIFLIAIGKSTFDYLMGQRKEQKVIPQKAEPSEITSQVDPPTALKPKSTSFLSFDSEPPMVKVKEQSVLENNNFNSIFQPQMEESVQSVQSIKNSKMSKENDDIPIKNQDRSEKDTEGEAFIRKNKSLQYIFGKTQFSVPQKISETNYQTEARRRQLPKIQSQRQDRRKPR